MKFKNKKKNYYKRLPLLAKAGMIADRSSPTTVPVGKPVGMLSSLLRSSSVPVGTVIYPDAPTRNSIYPVLPPMTPLRSRSNEDYVDAVDYEFELEKAEIRAEGAQMAAAKATAAREAAEAYVINRQQAVYNFTEYAQVSMFSSPKDWAEVRVAKERLANAKRTLREAITMEKASVALAAERKNELQEARIKANEFKTATKKSLSRRVIGATRKIMTTLRGSRRKSKAHK
jgi:hypothetical protein